MAALEDQSRDVQDVFNSFLISDLSDREKNESQEGNKKIIKPTVDSRNKEAYFQRLASFSSVTWPAKPEEASPIICAQYGWVNTEVDLLKCSSCSAVLSGQLPKRFEIELYAEACKKLVKNITRIHHKFCPWPTNPTPATFSQPWLWSKDEIYVNITNAVHSLGTIDPLPELITGIFCEEDFQCVKNFAGVFASDVDRRVLHLVAQGWRRSKSKWEMQSLSCHFCLRIIGLWNYATTAAQRNAPVEKNHINGEENDLSSPLCKRRKLTHLPGTRLLNPAEEHKPWCPWVRRVTICTGLIVPGWRAFLTAVKPTTSKTVTSSEANEEICKQEQISKIRDLLTKWTSPIK